MAKPAQEPGKNKECKKTRRPRGKAEHYWGHSHLPNQLRKALRIVNRLKKFREKNRTHEKRQIAIEEAKRFIRSHGSKCKACEVVLDARFDKAIKAIA
jgi:pyruvate/2-oxoacid:ferredoxin oxidoreductase alpha subunit